MGLKDFFKKKEVVVKPETVENPITVEKSVTVDLTPKKAKTAKTMKANPIVTEWDKAVDKVVAKEFREEAKEILTLTTEETRKEFLKYFGEDNGNICCLVLDKAKHDLIKEGKVQSKEDDAFGKPFMM